MFGPPGIMAKAGRGEFGVSICEDYGLFPRSVLQVFLRVQELNRQSSAADGEGPLASKRFVLSCSAMEMSVSGHEDMFARPMLGVSRKLDWSGNAHGVFIDEAPNPPCVRGHEEQVIDTEEDVLRVFEVMSSRNTKSTKLNDSSSRSHCICWLHLYAFDEATKTIRKTKFQFCDLAGSERMKDAHGVTNFADAGVDGWQGMMTNFGLMMLSQAVRAKVRLQKSKKHKLSHRSAAFACTLVPLLFGSIAGTDFTGLVVCCSQLPENASQTINALNFGATFAKLHVTPKQARVVSLKSMVKQAQKVIDENTAALAKKRAGGKDNRYTMMRQAKLQDAQQLLSILGRFQG